MTAGRGQVGPAALLVLLLALGTAALVPVAFGDAPQDDAYISYVYSRNFARGHGLVFNAGERPVEGYTNYLWTVAIGWGMRLGMDPEAVVPWVGLALTLATVLATFALARKLGSSAWFASLAALLFATRPTLAVHAMGGMETPLFGLLVVLGILPRLADPARTGLREDWTSAGFLALAALTRPEGVLIYGLLELGELAGALRRGAAALAPWFRRTLVRALPFVLVVGSHVAWRRVTYGDWVPNTFHAKVSAEPSIWMDGLRYVGQGLLFFGPVFVLLPYLFGPREAALRRGRFLCLWVGTVFLVYVVYAGGDYIPSYRFLWPMMPLWSALAAAALTALVARASEGARSRATAVASAAFVVLLAGQTTWEYLGGHRWTGMHERHAELVEAGKELDEVLPAEAWIAVTNAGRLPYFADRRTLDMMGLSDAHIARARMTATPELAGHLKGDGAYVLERAPDLILFIRLVVTGQPLARDAEWLKSARRMAFGISERQIAWDPRFPAEYRLISLPLRNVGAWLNVFAREGAFGDELPRGALVAPPGGS